MGISFGFGQSVAALVVALAALFYGAPGLMGLPAELGPPAAIVLLALGLWATGVLPPHITALLIFTLAAVLGIAPPEVIFGGFTTAGLWLVFGGLVLAAAIEATGLGRRFARPVLASIGGTHRRVIYGTVGVALALAFLVPAAMGRIVILIPIFTALGRELGYASASRGMLAILLAVTFGSFFPSFAILPANLPNMILLGAMETIYGETVSYGAYLALHFPVLGLLKALLLAELICRLFPAVPSSRPASSEAHAENGGQGMWSAAEMRLFGILLLALALWATDWLHGISPGWVALLAGLLCLLPGIGVLSGRDFQTRINFNSFLYAAGLLGMVRLIDQSGLGEALGRFLLDVVPLQPGATLANYAALVGVSAITCLLTAIAGSPAVLTPLAAPMADASGLPLMTVLMVQVIGFSSMLFPYQGAPLVVGLQIANVPLRDATRLSVLLGVSTLVLLVPLNYLWWWATGWLA